MFHEIRWNKDIQTHVNERRRLKLMFRIFCEFIGRQCGFKYKCKGDEA